MQPAAPIDIYARVSQTKTDRYKPDPSTDAQVAICRSILKERGLPIGETHVDPGLSAWNPKVYRKHWEALMARLESGAAGGVIVYDLERFARQPIDGERLIRAAKNGLQVLNTESEYDLTGPDGKAAFRDHMKMAAYYSDNLQRKVKRGKKAKAMSGKVDMRRSFGFDDDGVTVCGDEAEVIREMAARLLAGETQDTLIKELNERPVPTITGAQWRYSNFRNVMLRPRNAGLIQHNGEIIPGVHLPGEPILDRLIYDRLVAKFTARKWGRPPSGRYLLTGLAVCGHPECGAPLSGRPLRGSARQPRPERRQYYCRACHHTYVDVQTLDTWAADWTIRTLSDSQQADAIAAAERELEQKRSVLEAEAAGIEADLRAMAEKHGNDLARAGSDRRRELLRFEYEATRGPLLDRLDDIDSEIAALAEEAPPPLPAGARTLAQVDPTGYTRLGWLADWEEGTTADRRAMVERALRGRKIVVGKGEAAKFNPDRVTAKL